MADPNITILVVDDTPESLRFVSAVLEDAGMTVLIAADGGEALQSLELAIPDLVIMDAMMPVLDGFETTRRIKADPRFARLPVIFMTGLTETEHVVRGLEAGGVDYVTKPIVVAELLARIRVHLGNARVSRGSQAALDDSGRPLIAVNSTGRALWTTPRAAEWLGRLFPDDFANGGALPPALCAALARQVGGDGQGVVRHDLEDGRIELTLVSRSGSDEWLFRLAEIREGAEQQLLAQRHALTEREAEVLLWISRGKANREISEILGISPRTVNKHLEQVFEKMGIENRASAAAAAVKTLAQ
jgi:DNA-binding NarL/FixJ family response regulator